jgi:flagellar motor switch protein FliG
MFDDLLSASDARIADLLHRATEEDCVVALRGASAQMRARFLQQMARPLKTHMVERINEDVVPSDSKAAQAKILGLARQL